MAVETGSQPPSTQTREKGPATSRALAASAWALLKRFLTLREGSVIVEKVKAEKVVNRGFDAESLEYVDMIEAGIIDPTKVERVALQNAASVASLLLTTEALVADLPEEKPAAAPPMPHGDMY